MTSLRGCGRLLAVLLTCGACSFGPSPRSLDPATGPEGAASVVTYAPGGQRDRGELVAVRDDGLLLLLPRGLTLVHYGAIREAAFSDTVGVGRFVGAGSAQQRRNLAGFARYPFGLTGDALDLVLESLRQDRLIEVRP